MDWTKAYEGIVIWVSPDKSLIKVRTHGGVLTCENEGFRVGDEVMFILDPGSNRPMRMLPKDVAKLKIEMALNPLHQLVTNDDKPIEKEVNDEIWDIGSEGPSFEEDPHQSCGEFGEDVEELANISRYADFEGDQNWTDYPW